MSLGLIGRKLGMTHVYQNDGSIDGGHQKPEIMVMTSL